ncbi:MAG TPA: hypothetical protein VNM66_03910 [Thermodesulfobacteriota bacterium]|nr:hypothetical protein [Thermodesulfobacteriota bacterium]
MERLRRLVAAPLSRWREALAGFAYGLTGYEFARHARAMRGELEALFMLLTVGELAGVPVLPPYYALRLLPHLLPAVEGWKRRVARPREIWEREEYELHGV